MRATACALLLVALSADAADILAIFPTPSYSHQIAYRAYAEELLRRGHSLTVVTTDPIRDPTLRNYTEIDVSFYYEEWNRRFDIASDDAWLLRRVPEVFLVAFADALTEICDTYMSHPEVRRLIRGDRRFDLFVVEFGVSSCFYPFARLSRNNYIGIFSMSHTTIVHSNVGNIAAGSYLPDPLLGELSRMSFAGRLRTTAFQLVGWIVYYYIMRVHTSIARKHFGEDLPPTEVFERNVSAVLLNNHFTMTFPRPMVPNLIDIGGPALHLLKRTPKPLQKSVAGRPRVILTMVGTVVVLLFLFGFGEGARILAVVPGTSLSHQIVYHRYLKELNRRGHDITVATPYPTNADNLANYRQIDFSHVNRYWRSIFSSSSESINFVRYAPEAFLLVMYRPIRVFCEMYLSHPEMQKLWTGGERFDLVVVEYDLINCVYPFIKLSGNVSLGIASYAMTPHSHIKLRSTSNPAHIPELGLDVSDSMSFLQRLRNAILYFNVVVFNVLVENMVNDVVAEHLGPNVPDVGALRGEIGVVLANEHPSSGLARPSQPKVIPIGGPPFHLIGLHPEPLPKDIQEFIDSARDGVIYFSLGSNVKSKAMPEEKRRAFMDAFKRIKQKVLWKWEEDVLPGKPDNVKIGKWLPQTDILAHPNVKAFITQGGLQSVSEATYHRIPMIVIPFFADQELNAKKIVSEGVAIRISYEDLDVESLSAALRDIIGDPKYRQNMARYSDLTQDQPQSPLERAVWWTEYVIRHKGAKHLRSAAVDMPWYQYLLLDVIAFLLVVVAAALYVIYAILRLLKRIVFGARKPKEE